MTEKNLEVIGKYTKVENDGTCVRVEGVVTNREAFERMLEETGIEFEDNTDLIRGVLRFYRDQLNEARDVVDILSYAIDMFTDRHPEYAEEILALIDYKENRPEDDE